MQARPSPLLIILVSFLIVPATSIAQEGHPLVGSWHGDRGATAANRSPITLIMDWDGQVITGLVNPGYEHMTLQNAKLNAKDWTVHFELDSKDSSGTDRSLLRGRQNRQTGFRPADIDRNVDLRHIRKTISS